MNLLKKSVVCFLQYCSSTLDHGSSVLGMTEMDKNAFYKVIHGPKTMNKNHVDEAGVGLCGLKSC